MMRTDLALRAYSQGPAERAGRMLDRWMQSMAAACPALIATLMEWQCTARERAQLAEMSDEALKDVGLSRADIMAELKKPRWRR